MHRSRQSTQDYQWPQFSHLFTLWLAPSFLHAQIDTWCRGRQTGGLSALRLQRCGPAVSRLIQPNLPLSQAQAPGCSPSSSPPEAQRTALVNTTHSGLDRGNGLLVKSILTILHKSSATVWRHTPQAPRGVCTTGLLHYEHITMKSTASRITYEFVFRLRTLNMSLHRVVCSRAADNWVTLFSIVFSILNKESPGYNIPFYIIGVTVAVVTMETTVQGKCHLGKFTYSSCSLWI